MAAGKTKHGPSTPGKKAFHRHVERTMAHNDKHDDPEKKRHLLLHYKKLNGRTVKRKVTPHAMRGHTLVGYDHKRKAIRSYRMERVQHMEKAAFFAGFEKAAYSDEETAMMLQHQAGGKAKHPGLRLLGTMAAGAGGGGLAGKALGKKGLGLAASAGIGALGAALPGGVAALSARGHNKRRDEARDILTSAPGEREKRISKANPDRFWSSFNKHHMQRAKSEMWDRASTEAPSAGVDKTGFVHSPAFGHVKNVAEVGGLGILGKGAVDDYRASDRGAHAKRKLALEGAGLTVLGLPAATELGHAAWNGIKRLGKAKV